MISDDSILAALRSWGDHAMTYVVANRLSPRQPTSKVRRRLQSMEKRGLVKRMPTSYVTQICWAPTDGAPADPDKGQDPHSSTQQERTAA